jgi:hypothetical protein
MKLKPRKKDKKIWDITARRMKQARKEKRNDKTE